jgi:autotransporter-associated beta strand protein/autotransporter passenger strand-loop-strand repeat protein
LQFHVISGTSIALSGSGAYGAFDFSNSGTANSFVIHDHVTMDIYSGGTASATIINSGGEQYIGNDGTASATTVNSGGLRVLGNDWIGGGGAANGTMVRDGGEQIVYGHGLAVNTTVSFGGKLTITSSYYPGDSTYYGYGTAENAVIFSGGTLSVTSGGMLAGDNSIADGGMLSASPVILKDSGTSLSIERNMDEAMSTVFAGNGSLIKTGTGTLTLTGANTYNGGTTVNAGILALSGTGSITPSLSGGGLALHGGATFDFSALNTTLAVPKLTVFGNGSPAGISAGGSYTANFSGANLKFRATKNKIPV